MTVSTFDPMCFGQYPHERVPKLLHFEYEGSTDIYRYVQVDRIPSNEIDHATRRKADEGPDANAVRLKYVDKDKIKE